jgi:hypothetical protein
VTRAAVVEVNVEWRCRRTIMGLNWWIAGSDSEETDLAGTRALVAGEPEAKELTRIQSPESSTDSCIFQDRAPLRASFGQNPVKCQEHFQEPLIVIDILSDETRHQLQVAALPRST